MIPSKVTSFTFFFIIIFSEKYCSINGYVLKEEAKDYTKSPSGRKYWLIINYRKIDIDNLDIWTDRSFVGLILAELRQIALG